MELDRDTVDLTQSLLQVRAMKRELEKREKDLREALMNRLGGESEGWTEAGEMAVEVLAQSRRTVNRGKLEALFPDVFAQVAEDKVIEVIKVREVSFPW